MKKILIILFSLALFTFSFSKEEVKVSTFDFNKQYTLKNINEAIQKKKSLTAVNIYENDIERMKRIENNTEDVDVVYFTDYYALMAKEKGLIMELDVSKLSNLEYIYSLVKDPVQGNYSIGYTVYSLGIVYRVDKIRRPLVSWKDLWREDLLKYLALPDMNNPEGPVFYKMLDEIFGADEDDWSLDKAFEKVVEIKNDIYGFYSSPNELQNLFENEEIYVAVVPKTLWGNLYNYGLNVIWLDPLEGNPGIINTLSILKNAENQENAYKYINFVINQSTQLSQALDLVNSPVNRNVVVPDSISENLVYSQSEVNGLIYFDLKKIVDNLKKWETAWKEIINE